jgi:ABC-type multidrug transport system fused ATPase/permease subunit
VSAVRRSNVRRYVLAVTTATVVLAASVGGTQVAAGHAAAAGGIVFVIIFTWGIWAVSTAVMMWFRHMPLVKVIDETHAAMARVERALTEPPEPQDGPDARVLQLRPRP